jgi:hypothetical protein
LARSEDESVAVTDVVDSLLRERAGALSLDASAPRREIAGCIVKYCRTMQLLLNIQWDLERKLRDVLEISVDEPFKPSSLQRPLPRALDWIEALLGYRLVCEPGNSDSVTLRNRLREVQVVWRDLGPARAFHSQYPQCDVASG